MINVLIADDSKIMRQIITKNLITIKEDVNIAEVITGRQALIEMKNFVNFNILFLDLNMPDVRGRELHGTDVITYLHQTQRLDNMWIVIISANLNTQTKLKLERFGIRYFIPKPFDKDKFMGVVLPILAELDCNVKIS